jgi:hypothetical protein
MSCYLNKICCVFSDLSMSYLKMLMFELCFIWLNWGPKILWLEASFMRCQLILEQFKQRWPFSDAQNSLYTSLPHYLFTPAPHPLIDVQSQKSQVAAQTRVLGGIPWWDKVYFPGRLDNHGRQEADNHKSKKMLVVETKDRPYRYFSLS